MLEVESGSEVPIRSWRPGSTPNDLASTPRWKRADESLWRTVLEDVVVVSARGDSEAFAISGGATLWKLLERPRELSELAASLGAPAGQAGLADLLASLLDAGVVERVA